MGTMNNRNVIVTGCGSEIGIGWAAAIRLAKEGANVLVTDINTEKLDSLVRQIESMGPRSVAVSADVTRREDVSRVVNTALAEFGAIDGLINNAGTGDGYTGFLECDDALLNMNLDVNFRSAWYFCQAVIPHMQSGGGGAIVNNASIVASRPQPFWTPYTIAKTAVIALTKSLAIEFGPENIRCNAVCPGLVQSELGQKAIEDTAKRFGITADEVIAAGSESNCMRRPGEAHEIADAMCYLLSDQSSYITGSVLDIAGGHLTGQS